MTDEKTADEGSWPPMTCEKCGRKGCTTERTLAGGRGARICLACNNRWTEWLYTCLEYREYHRAKAYYDWAVHQVLDADAEPAVDRVLSAFSELYVLSGEWLAEKEATVASEPPK